MKTRRTSGQMCITALLSIMLAVGSFSFALPASAQTAADLTAQLNALLAQVAALQAELQAKSGSSAPAFAGVPSTFRFARNLTTGSRGTDVRYLQIMLNASADTRVNSAGFPGGPGSETEYFGSLTKAAVVKFQNKYRSEILTPAGLFSGTGYVGPMTRAKLNTMLAGAPVPPPPPPPVVSSTLIVTGSNLGTTLLPQGALRVPMLQLNLSATGASAVTVSSITVNVGGVVQTGALDGLVMLDANGGQIGQARVVGSSRQVVFNEPIVIAPGTTKTITIGANLAANLAAFQGQTVQLSLVEVRSNATQQSISLPIVGPSAQINATFPIGTASVQAGSTGLTSGTRDIGTQGYNFSSIRVNAGSQEDVMLNSIRWTQNGSAGTGDLANVVTTVDGTAYPTSLSGRTYTTLFGSGLRIPRGTSKEVTVRANITGGAGRTILFDVEQSADIVLSGSTFGFGIAPTPLSTATASTVSAEFTTGTPFFSGAQITVTGGAVTLSRAGSVPSQNISVNVPNQPLGGFDLSVSAGESVNVSQLQFTVGINRSSGSSASVSDIRSVTLVSSNGTVVSGPVDASGGGTSGTVTFSSLIFPSGSGTYTVKGTLGSSFRDGDTITLSLTPSLQFTGIRGQTTGTTITASPSTSVSGNPMTVRSAAITVSVSTTPVAQTVVAGAQAFTFAQFQIDASSSGEDVRFTSLPVRFTHSTDASQLSGCQLYSGSTAMTTGGNTINPSSSHSSGTDLTFSFDSPLVVARNTVATVSLKCNVSSSASSGSTWSFGMVSAPTGVGVSSGQSITANVIASTGQAMTVASSGSFTVMADLGTPTYQVAAAGSSAIAGILSFRAGNESVRIDQVALQLTPTSGSTASSPSDLESVALLDDSGAQVGSAFFPGTNRTTTVQLSSSFVIPQNGERKLTIRPTFTQIGTGQPGTEGALIRIDYDGDAAAATRGVGLASGATVTSGSASDTAFAGVRVFKSIPTVTSIALPSSSLTSGDTALLRFKIDANANGPVGIYKFTLNVTPSSGVTVSDMVISAYADSSFSSPAGVNALGRVDPTPQAPDGSGNAEIYARNSSGTSVPLQVPAGSTRYFEVRGTVTGGASGSTVVTRILGDAAYPSFATLMGTAAGVDADANDNLIWSPNRDTQSSPTDSDWTNAYGIPNLPSSGIVQALSR